MSDRASDPDRSTVVNRRTFLARVAAAGAGAVLASRLSVPGGSAAAQDATVRPDPTAKPGGTLRYGVHTAPAHFDLHQSGTVSNIGAQGPMYDCLIRRDPHDGQTIIPDLAYKWDVAPDGKKYTFHLRKGVKFHDGADFTAADVKATYERIVRPPKGVVIPRSSLFTAVGERRASIGPPIITSAGGVGSPALAISDTAASTGTVGWHTEITLTLWPIVRMNSRT